MFRIYSLLFILNSLLFSETLVLGVVPQQSPQKLYKAWSPIINYLSQETGIDIVFKTERSIPSFEKELYLGKYDIAYSNPYHYILAHEKVNHNALARFDKMIVGILVVNKESNIRTLDNIINKEFLFPAPKAFAATLLTKYEVLNKKNFSIEDSEKFRYVNSHDSVYLGIERNIGDVGGGIIRTFNKFKNNDKLRIIYKTDQYPSHPISISSKVNKEDREKIKNALLKMPVELSKLINSKKLIETDNREYEVVKELALKIGVYNIE